VEEEKEEEEDEEAGSMSIWIVMGRETLRKGDPKAGSWISCSVEGDGDEGGRIGRACEERANRQTSAVGVKRVLIFICAIVAWGCRRGEIEAEAEHNESWRVGVRVVGVVKNKKRERERERNGF